MLAGLTIKSRWTILVVDSCNSLAGLCVMTRWPQIQLLQIIHLGSQISVYWQADLVSWEKLGGKGGGGVKRGTVFCPPCTLSCSESPAWTRLVISSHAPRHHSRAGSSSNPWICICVGPSVGPTTTPPCQSTGWKHLAFFCYFYMKAERGLLWKIIMKSFCVAASIQILFWTVLWC